MDHSALLSSARDFGFGLSFLYKKCTWQKHAAARHGYQIALTKYATAKKKLLLKINVVDSLPPAYFIVHTLFKLIITSETLSLT